MAGGATTFIVSHAVEQVEELCKEALGREKGRQVALCGAGRICRACQQFLDKAVTLEQAKAACAAEAGTETDGR